MLAHRIAVHGLDRREGHAFPTEVFQRVVDELTSDATSARASVHREIRNATLARLAVEERCDVAENLPVFVRDEDPAGFAA